MIDCLVILLMLLNVFVLKLLSLCEFILFVCDVFYFFVVIYENGWVGCIFNDEI